jgi:hypothetical protein
MSKLKKVSCFGFFLILLAHLNYSLVAEENATESKSLRLVSEIKQELKELERTQKVISEKFPLKNKFEIKEVIYSELVSFFKKDNHTFDEYFKSLTSNQREDFWEYLGILGKETWYKQISNSNEIIEMMEALKKNPPDKEWCLRFMKWYDSNKEKPADSEINKCKMLREKLNVPEPVIDYLTTSTRYHGLFEFYSTVIRIIDDPVDKQRRKIIPLLKELTVSNKNESDKMIQKETEDFIKNSWKVFPVSIQVPNIGTRDYYIIKLFSDCMQLSQKKEVIEKVLQESKLMRKAIITLIIGARYGNRKNIEKNAEGLDYDNFGKYWLNLQEISKGLTDEIFPGDKQRMEGLPTAATQATMGKCYLECFFTPYLVLDNP